MEENRKLDETIGILSAASDRKAYETPRLQSFGNVKTLTTGGTNVGCEDTADPSSRSAMGGTPGCPSDRRMKQNIVKIGTHPLGFGLYLFDFKPEHRDTAGHGRQFGVMADEVDVVMLEAVSMHADGYKRVNYDMLGIESYL